MPTDSGRPHDIHRCQACWTALWSDYGRRPALRFVPVGTLGEPARLRPDVHIYTRSKLPWMELPKGVPAFEAYYDTKAQWPAASLERRRASLRQFPPTPRHDPRALPTSLLAEPSASDRSGKTDTLGPTRAAVWSRSVDVVAPPS
jgi:Glutathione-dependent formaldehyde-activating enzyme